MGRKTEIYWNEDDDPREETAWDEEDVVRDVEDRNEVKRSRPMKRKRAKTSERYTSSSDDGGIATVAAEGSSLLASTNTATKVDPRERHKLAERERRKSMRELFLSLHALLPNGDAVRQEQSAILDEIVKYIPLAASRLRSLRIDAQRRRRATRRKETSSSDPEILEASGCDPGNYTAAPSSSGDSSCSSSSSSSSDMTTTTPIPTVTNKRPRETSSAVNYYACHSRSGSTTSINTLATGSPSSGRNRKTKGPSKTEPDDCCAVDIQVTPEPTTSVSIRLRGDRVNVSITDHCYAKQPTPQSSLPHQPTVLLSTVLDELDAHHLEVIRSTHCRDGSKLLHYSESKIKANEESTYGYLASTSTGTLKKKLQDLAFKLQTMRKTTIVMATCTSST